MFVGHVVKILEELLGEAALIFSQSFQGLVAEYLDDLDLERFIFLYFLQYKLYSLVMDLEKSS